MGLNLHDDIEWTALTWGVKIVLTTLLLAAAVVLVAFLVFDFG